MGPYPVCRIAADADIQAGLEALRSAGAVSVVLAADPLAGPDLVTLAQEFPLCRPFKTHYLADRDAGPIILSKHHRDRVRRGERHTTALVVPFEERKWQAVWCGLYAELIARRGLTGLHAFPAAAFEVLAALPRENLVAFAAETPNGEVTGMQLWLRCGERAYSHLAATSQSGYKSGSSYVLYAAAIEHFSDCRVLDFGGGAGVMDNPDDDLATFKRGFSNSHAVAHLCGAVLDGEAYARLKPGSDTPYFPAYRHPR